MNREGVAGSRQSIGVDVEDGRAVRVDDQVILILAGHPGPGGVGFALHRDGGRQGYGVAGIGGDLKGGGAGGYAGQAAPSGDGKGEQLVAGDLIAPHGVGPDVDGEGAAQLGPVVHSGLAHGDGAVGQAGLDVCRVDKPGVLRGVNGKGGDGPGAGEQNGELGGGSAGEAAALGQIADNVVQGDCAAVAVEVLIAHCHVDRPEGARAGHDLLGGRDEAEGDGDHRLLLPGQGDGDGAGSEGVGDIAAAVQVGGGVVLRIAQIVVHHSPLEADIWPGADHRQPDDLADAVDVEGQVHNLAAGDGAVQLPRLRLTLRVYRGGGKVGEIEVGGLIHRLVLRGIQSGGVPQGHGDVADFGGKLGRLAGGQLEARHLIHVGQRRPAGDGGFGLGGAQSGVAHVEVVGVQQHPALHPFDDDVADDGLAPGGGGAAAQLQQPNGRHQADILIFGVKHRRVVELTQ